MTITIETTEVTACSATACTYNLNGSCHARAITVGDGLHAMCDTFLVTGSHCRDSARHAGVGACKVSACRHNEDYECQAESIQLRVHDEHADCMTFTTA